MGYVYGSTKKPGSVTAQVQEPDPEEAEQPPTPPRRVPGRKRGAGKKNRHGYGCGTPNGWAAHKRAGEDPCEPCWKARREYKNELERAGRARLKAEAAARTEAA